MTTTTAPGRVPRQHRFKRSTRQRLFRGALYAVFLAAVLALVLVADWGAIQVNYLDGEVWRKQFPEIITLGVKNTVLYTIEAFVLGFILALILALMKLAPVAPYRWVATAYIEFFRGLPALVVILGVGLTIPLAFGVQIPGGNGQAGVVALTLVYGAYMAETIRAGIQAVPKGQYEASRSLGMSSFHTMRSVTLPQAIRIVIPPLTNELVALLKDTSLIQFLGFAVAQRELTALASDNVNNFANASPLLAAAVFYLIITLPLTQLVAWMERRGMRAR
ncbi:MAG TPA: amino acid ABC transporter permease [Marmoricola sp.]|nr:amino acid ABC transporter permease [Marmoricola sp.]